MKGPLFESLEIDDREILAQLGTRPRELATMRPCTELDPLTSCIDREPRKRRARRVNYQE